MTPYGWGHSHLLGRVKYHLKWTFKRLNVTQEEHALISYFKKVSFPDVTPFGRNKKLCTRLLKVDSLQAYEAASAMITVLFALICYPIDISDQIVKAWRLENTYSIDFYRSSFTDSQIKKHQETRQW